MEGYGLTETTGGRRSTRPDNVRIGTVGRPLPGAHGSPRTARSCSRVATSSVVTGTTRKRPPRCWPTTAGSPPATSVCSTTAVSRGITGRKKDLIDASKNVALAVLEDLVRSDRIISHRRRRRQAVHRLPRHPGRRGAPGSPRSTDWTRRWTLVAARPWRRRSRRPSTTPTKRSQRRGHQGVPHPARRLLHRERRAHAEHEGHPAQGPRPPRT